MTDLSPEQKELHERQFARLVKQREDFNKALAAVHNSFAHMEGTFATLLNALIHGSEQGTNGLTYAVYFAITSTEGRVGAVDAALRMKYRAVTHRDLIAQWGRLMNRFNRARKTRNQIIHGQVVTTYTSGKENHLRLTPILSDIARLMDGYRHGQLWGMSAHDVEQNAAALSRVSEDVGFFIQIAEGDAVTYQRTLAELAARYPTAQDRLDSPTPQEPEFPPQSSPE